MVYALLSGLLAFYLPLIAWFIALGQKPSRSLPPLERYIVSGLLHLTAIAGLEFLLFSGVSGSHSTPESFSHRIWSSIAESDGLGRLILALSVPTLTALLFRVLSRFLENAPTRAVVRDKEV